MRTIDWVVGAAGGADGQPSPGAVVIVDQTALPHEVRHLTLTDVDDLVGAVRRLAVRGAPALGAAGAVGVLLALQQARDEGWDDATLHAAVARVRGARPTAVNLAWGVDRVAARLPDGLAAVEAEARAVLAEDVTANRAMAERGADLLDALCGRDDQATASDLRVHTHCNAGALACVEVGTALGVVRALHSRGRLARVYADETRPLLQGARLTAWELAEMGADYRVVVDGAGSSLIARGLVDAVVVGADRIAANGDVANKIGTYPLALAAARAGVPFVVAAPESTVDPATPDGGAIEIEDRDPDEVLTFAGHPVAPPGARAVNPAFDVTPADLVTAIVTETRVVRTAQGDRPG
ncbi:MAG: S-methyl-5-thioribose-1-phosphate isomerase [Acidimicrobiales bacterium]|nr:S-methyl-5-thioribose-1-phosphate isomerase [Acidimicrobiales bacterium]